MFVEPVVMMIGVGVGIGRLVPDSAGDGDSVSGVRGAGNHCWKCDVRADGGVFDGSVQPDGEPALRHAVDRTVVGVGGVYSGLFRSV